MGKKQEVYEVIVIGTGPAGISASIYTSRAKLSTLIIGKPEEGALYKAKLVENYFGFAKGVGGKTIVEDAMKQTQRFGTKFVRGEAVNATKGDDGTFTVKMEDGTLFLGKNLIITTGKAYKILGAPNEEKLSGKGVHYCATCDGYAYQKKKVVVVGHSNLAAEEATVLQAYTKDITIVSNGLDFSMSDFMLKQLKKNKVVMRKDKIKDVVGTKKLEGLALADGSTLKCDGAFMALGRVSATSFATKLGITTKNNDIVIDRDGHTDVEGVFAGGNCTGGNAQAANSVGEGANAALSVIKKAKGMASYIDYD